MNNSNSISKDACNFSMKLILVYSYLLFSTIVFHYCFPP